jgi:hypothetical protein
MSERSGRQGEDLWLSRAKIGNHGNVNLIDQKSVDVFLSSFS